MLNRTQPPEIHDISLPEIPFTEEIALGNDINATILNQGEQPVLLLELVFPIGRFNEPAPGIAYYAAKMLAEGTPSRTAEAIASEFDFYGSHLEITATLDFIHIKLYALNKFFPELMSLLTEILAESHYPEREFETLKNIRVQQIRQQMAKNNAYASIKFRENLFGAAHPYGLVIDEGLSGIISIEQLREFKPSLLTRPYVFLSGKVGDQERKVMESSFNELKFSPNLPEMEASPTTGQSETIRRENSTQASIRIGHLTITRHSPDIHRLRVVNELFGGFFGSRLMKNIREEKGLTYSIHSSISHLQKASYWSVSTEVLHDKVDLAIGEITRELTKLRENPPSEEEFRTVISYMKGKFLNSFDTPFHSLNMIKNLKLAGISPNYLKSFVETLDEMTPQDVTETAKKYLEAANAVTITVL